MGLVLKISILWHIMLCISLKANRNFGGKYCLLHAGLFLAYSLAHIEKLKCIYVIKRKRIENEDSSHIQNSTIMLAHP